MQILTKDPNHHPIPKCPKFHTLRQLLQAQIEIKIRQGLQNANHQHQFNPTKRNPNPNHTPKSDPKTSPTDPSPSTA
jgi:hypothetical protein